MIGSPPPPKPPREWYCFVCDEVIADLDYAIEDNGVRHNKCKVPEPTDPNAKYEWYN